MLNLTKLVFAALDEQGLEPVMGQRAVCAQGLGVGTAADIVCFDQENNELVVVELKTGCNGWRNAPAVKAGQQCTMKGALRKAPDTVLNRHLAQLALTHYMLCSEKRTMASLAGMGVSGVSALLLYANDSGVDSVHLPEWWSRKAASVMPQLR